MNAQAWFDSDEAIDISEAGYEYHADCAEWHEPDACPEDRRKGRAS